jgi:hypothetical protein
MWISVKSGCAQTAYFCGTFVATNVGRLSQKRDGRSDEDQRHQPSPSDMEALCHGTMSPDFVSFRRELHSNGLDGTIQPILTRLNRGVQ